MCAVRELTEGTPRIWTPSIAGQKVAGAVLAVGKTVSTFQSLIPYVDLWQGGTNRIRVIGYGAKLSSGIESARPRVGDTLEIIFMGMGTVPANPLAGRRESRRYRDFSITVTRGHH